MNAGDTAYYLFYNEMSFLREELLFESIEVSKGKKITRQLFEEEQCIETITFTHPIVTNKRFYVQLQAGSSSFSSNPKSWKSRFGDPLISTFNPVIFGGEFAKKIGISKHYLGFEFNVNRQNSVTPVTSFPTEERRWININQMGVLYRYFIQLDKKNKMIVAPKLGIGLINVEEKTNNPSIQDRTIDANSGFAFSFGIQPEYRFSKNFSALLNADYTMGAINAVNRDNLNLNQFRLFVGLKYQFNN